MVDCLNAMKTRAFFSRASACFSVWISACALHAQMDITTLGLTRQAAPGTANGVIYSAFDMPVVGTGGEAALLATLEGSGVGAANNQGLWSYSNLVGVLVQREGFPAAGTPVGVLNNGFTTNTLVLNSSHQVAFIASLTGSGVASANNQGLWSGQPGSLTLVARKGDPATGLPAGVNYNGFEALAFNNMGQIAFKGSLTGVGVGSVNNAALWAGPPGALMLVARKGSQAAAVMNGQLYDTLGMPVFNDAAQIAFKATLTGAGVGTFNNEAIWAGATNALAVVARKGSQAAGTPDQVIFNGFETNPPAYNRSNQVAFVSSLTGAGVGSFNDSGLWFGAPGALMLVAREGSTAADLPAGVNYSSFGRPAINSAPWIAFKATLTGAGVSSMNDEVIYAGPPDALSLIARSSSSAPGTAAGVTFDTLSDPSINQFCRIVFKASLTGTGINSQNNEGIWTADTDGNVQLILQKGMELTVVPGDNRTIDTLGRDFYPGNGEDGLPRTLNEQGQVALNLGLRSGTNALVMAHINTTGTRGILSIARTNDAVQISWSGTGFVLQSASSITGSWSKYTNQSNPQIVPIESGERYFRLGPSLSP